MPKDALSGFPVYWMSLGPEDAAPALALHCALAHSGAWYGVVKALGGRLSVTAPDMPGHGRSAKWGHRGNFHDQVTEIAECFVEDGTTLLGHSFGATVALRLAQRHADRIRRVVLIEPVLFAAAREHAPARYEARLRGERPMMAAVAHGDLEAAARDFTAAWGGGRDWSELGPRARAQLMEQIRIIAEIAPALWQDSRGILQPGGLESCHMPVLLLRGEKTDPILADIHAALVARLPDARDAVVPGAGHMVPITHAENAAGRIASFLDAT